MKRQKSSVITAVIHINNKQSKDWIPCGNMNPMGISSKRDSNEFNRGNGNGI